MNEINSDERINEERIRQHRSQEREREDGKTVKGLLLL